MLQSSRIEDVRFFSLLCLVLARTTQFIVEVSSIFKAHPSIDDEEYNLGRTVKAGVHNNDDDAIDFQPRKMGPPEAVTELITIRSSKLASFRKCLVHFGTRSGPLALTLA